MTGSQLKVNSQSRLGTVVVVSLDGLPVISSSCILLKMCTVATNSGQQLGTAPRKSPKGYRLASLGAPPIHTQGKASARPTQIFLGGRKLAEVYMSQGTFELVITSQQGILFCDTPGVKFQPPGQRTIVYPRDAKLMVIEAEPTR